MTDSNFDEKRRQDQLLMLRQVVRGSKADIQLLRSLLEGGISPFNSLAQILDDISNEKPVAALKKLFPSMSIETKLALDNLTYSDTPFSIAARVGTAEIMEELRSHVVHHSLPTGDKAIWESVKAKWDHAFNMSAYAANYGTLDFFLTDEMYPRKADQVTHLLQNAMIPLTKEAADGEPYKEVCERLANWQETKIKVRGYVDYTAPVSSMQPDQPEPPHGKLVMTDTDSTPVQMKLNHRLFLAVHDNSATKVAQALAAGADPNATIESMKLGILHDIKGRHPKQNETILHFAMTSCQDNMDVVLAFFEHDLNCLAEPTSEKLIPCKWFARGEAWRTPLLLAYANGYHGPHIVLESLEKELMPVHASFNARDINGKDMTDYFKEIGVRKNFSHHFHRQFDKEGYVERHTELLQAVWDMDYKKAAELTKRDDIDFNVLVQDLMDDPERNGNTLLHEVALLDDNAKMLSYFVVKADHGNWFQPNAEGVTPYDIIRERYAEPMKWWLDVIETRLAVPHSVEGIRAADAITHPAEPKLQTTRNLLYLKAVMDGDTSAMAELYENRNEQTAPAELLHALLADRNTASIRLLDRGVSLDTRLATIPYAKQVIDYVNARKDEIIRKEVAPPESNDTIASYIERHGSEFIKLVLQKYQQSLETASPSKSMAL